MTLLDDTFTYTLPTYTPRQADPRCVVEILNETDLGNHQVRELADGGIVLLDNRCELEEHGYQAEEAVRLDQEEAYRLYVTLHALFSLKQHAA